ncbi:uncharacterized protein LOC129748342 [Uranotaenia lowii]|uniref:uncharacterized protein LOC129748342 n=1 Tax=Uranotaenia lowii TaxID=190385 RepID=UPI002479CD79|nr:uncharacterized protein LOC129748342 [Uranotaenia lowii]XP_055598885.1 uncharacterized protein LOC129748342 [Uranotaenia lowii]XP_055598886.1 uncharacterized protein LOC129748342 [Uranotaenia lowii]
MPAYAGFDSYTTPRSRASESIYYTAPTKEYDSFDDYMRPYHPPALSRRASMIEHSMMALAPPMMGPPMTPTTDTIFSRRYVDPWDMENYIYVRKQVLDPTSESEVPPSPAGEPIQSKFYYVPGDIESCRECSAEIVSPVLVKGSTHLHGDEEDEEDLRHHRDEDEDEDDDGIEGDDDLEADELDAEDDGYYAERYDTVMEEDSIGGDDRAYSSYTDLESSSEDQPSSCDSSMSALRLHTPGFGKSATSRRPIVLPKPIPQLEFPGPPSYDYYEPPCCCMTMPPHPGAPHHLPPPLMDMPGTVPPSIAGGSGSGGSGGNYYSLNDCFECAGAGPYPPGPPMEHVPLYATSRQSPMRRRSRSTSVVSHMSMARRPSHIGVPPLPPPPVATGPVDPSSAVSIAATNANVCYTPQHFSLSKKGLLQIDYSCNWDNLDRYITK